MKNNIDKEILDLIEDLFEFYKDDDWLTVKKFLCRYLRPDLRKKFSTRNQKSKKHLLNNFEKLIISYCKNKYNRNLILKKEDTHYDI